MSHVDDGQVHAYLDRQLEFADRAAREALEAHVAECPECAARLDEARTLHGRAAAILHNSEPVAVEPPPFEAVVDRAAVVAPTVARVRTLKRTRTLAWAASVVLAIGVGWYARFSTSAPAQDAALEARLQPESGVAATPRFSNAQQTEAPAAADDRDEQPSPAAPPVTARTRALADEAAAGPAVVSIEEQVQAAAADPRARGAGARSQDTIALAETNEAFLEAPSIVADQRQARKLQARADDRLEQEAAPAANRAAAPQAGPDSMARERRRVVDQLARSRVAPLPADIDSVAREIIGGQPRDFASVAGYIADGVAWLPVDLRAAESILGRPVVGVPGLEIIGVASTEPGREPVVIRVVQQLPSGDSLELLQVKSTTEADEVSGALQPRGRTVGAGGVSPAVASVTIGDLVVTGRAAIPIDSLGALLERLRDAPHPD